MIRYLLDTDTLSLLLRRDPVVQDFVKRKVNITDLRYFPVYGTPYSSGD